jgi:hypothetical protein
VLKQQGLCHDELPIAGWTWQEKKEREELSEFRRPKGETAVASM